MKQKIKRLIIYTFPVIAILWGNIIQYPTTLGYLRETSPQAFQLFLPVTFMMTLLSLVQLLTILILSYVLVHRDSSDV